jgi:hypothetical protein
LTPEQIAICEADPVKGLHMVSVADRNAMVAFYVDHKQRGHDVGPGVVGPLAD